MLNIIAGLFIGFSFWKSSLDQAGTQVRSTFSSCLTRARARD